jgi:hypothetical protein
VTRRLPISAFLLLQATISLWNLGQLSSWMDEAYTLRITRQSPAAVVQIAAHDIHPPLFYLLLWSWQRLPLPLDEVVKARLLTVIIALAATFAADRLLAIRLPASSRNWFLLLWCCSPCLLLYSRMCRSYSLQALTAVFAAAAYLRCLEKPETRRIPAVSLAILAALYTHYVPGIAFLAAANLALMWNRRWRDTAMLNGLTAAGLLPWMVWLVQSLDAWSRHRATYAAIGGAAEMALKAGFWGMSVLAGEAVPDSLLAAALALAPLLALALYWGAALHRRVAGIATLVAVVGFIGVARWVSYPFVPARMLFVLPLLLLLLGASVAVRPRAGALACAALLAISLAGDWCYFQKLGFRNKQYPMPMREIAELIPRDAAVLVDSTNSDIEALEYALGRPALATGDPAADAPLGAAQVVYFLRNTHDLSADGRNARYEAMLKGRLRLVNVRRYEPFTALELRMMRRMGMINPPRYFSELLEFR